MRAECALDGGFTTLAEALKVPVAPRGDVDRLARGAASDGPLLGPVSQEAHTRCGLLQARSHDALQIVDASSAPVLDLR